MEVHRFPCYSQPSLAGQALMCEVWPARLLLAMLWLVSLKYVRADREMGPHAGHASKIWSRNETISWLIELVNTMKRIYKHNYYPT